MEGLTSASEAIGIPAYSVWANFENFQTLELPVIAHIKVLGFISHYIVIYEIHGNYLLIMDPGIGLLRKISCSRFLKIWTKALIIFQEIE